MKVTRVFKTVGPLEGKTVTLAGIEFVDGVGTFTGQHIEADRMGRFLHRNWQVAVVSPEEAPELVPAPEPTPPEQQPNQTQVLGNQRLAEALAKLDPENDDHWTKLGKPAMSAVEQLYGSADITRGDVEAAIKDFDRNTARTAKAEAASAQAE